MQLFELSSGFRDSNDSVGPDKICMEGTVKYDSMLEVFKFQAR